MAASAVAMAACWVSPAAHGQSTITNIASLTYQTPTGPVTSVTSNPVATQVLDPTKVPTIALYLDGGSGSGSTSTVVDGGCAPTQAGNVVNLVPATMIAPGMKLYAKVHDDMANRSTIARDTIAITVTFGGQSLALTLVETGANTGDFAGVVSVGLTGDPSACTLGVSGAGSSITATYAGNALGIAVKASATTASYNVVFDTSARKVIDGTKVTIVDAATGQPAMVRGVDGVSSFPSTVTSGASVVDSAGRTYVVPSGGFLFPQLAPGNYRLVVEPSANYVFPSATTPADFASHPVIGGKPVTVTDGSYGKPFTVTTLFDNDVPLDPGDAGLIVTKTVSAVSASPGDYLQYRVTVQNRSATSAVAAPSVTDILPQGLRYQAGSFKVNGVKVADPAVASDGRQMIELLPAMAAGQTVTLTYVLAVTSNAPVGDAVNSVSAKGGAVTSNVAKATVRISGGFFSDAVTIIGRVVSDSCNPTSPNARPVPGVRILLEDGTYVLTDENGQYHIENVRPGLHVAQVDRNSIPTGYSLEQCRDDTRRAGSDFSQFIDARGGALWRADFFLRRAPDAPPPPGFPGAPKATTEPKPAVDVTAPSASSGPAPMDDAPDPTLIGKPNGAALSDDARAAGVGINWISQATGKSAILFPPEDHNPRAPVVRVVVARTPGDSVELSVNGQPVDPLNRDPGATNPQGTAAVDIWSGLPLVDGRNVIVARVKRPDGSVETLTRDVTYTNSVDRAEFVREKSRLVADGRTSPIIALRIVDRNGKPVRAGVSGRIDVSAPYETADSVQRRRDSQLVGTTAASDGTWRVAGDDGIAYVELAPTSQTGEVLLNLHLRDNVGNISRLSNNGSVLDRGDQVRAWLSPGDQDWVVVGFAAGSAGYTALATQGEALSRNPGKIDQVDGQVKLYAKGRIKGKWLLTLAYDSDKQSDAQRRQSLLTTIDPEAYYILYGDRAQQGYDAQSTKNIYVRIEAPQFYALFGDFATDFNETELGSYQRVLTGVKAQYQSQKTRFSAFVASTPFRHQRDEIQGQGVTGPYSLARRDIVANTDIITLQTRDRIRPELVTGTQVLTRFIDYDIDYARGTVTLRQPLLSRDTSFNPQYLVVEYDTFGAAKARTVAGVRIAQKVGRKLTIGATGIQNDDDRKTRLGAVDITLDLDSTLRVRGEAGYSGGGGQNGYAYVVEADKRTSKLEARAYIREQSLNYGVGEQNAVEAGYRKIGADVAALVGKSLTLAGSAFQTDDLTSLAQRRSIRVDLQTKLDNRTTVTGTIQAVNERDSNGVSTTTTQIGAALSRSMFDNRLKLTGEAQISIGSPGTVTTPTLYRIGASYAITSGIRAIGEYEIASGNGITAGNLRAGIEVTPWRGGQITASWNRQQIQENGDRTFAVMGMKQSLPIAKNWTADLSLDSSRSLSGERITADPVNPLQAPAMGGTYLGSTLDSDYTAMSAGLAYQTKKLTWTNRVEARFGDYSRFGLTTALIRQLDDGRVLGGSGTLYTMRQTDGGKVDHGDIAFAVALRAPTARLQILDKLEGVYDRVALGTGLPSASYTTIPLNQNTIAGLAEDTSYGPIAAVARTATVSRIVNNLAINWIASPKTEAGYRTQVSVYYGAKYAVQSFDGDRYGGFTDMLSVEARQDITTWLDIGFQGGIKHSWSLGTLQYTLGPTIGISPVRNTWLSVGYNFTGFNDRDFSGARSTVKGAWVAFRLKFDEELLGLARRNRR